MNASNSPTRTPTALATTHLEEGAAFSNLAKRDAASKRPPHTCVPRSHISAERTTVIVIGAGQSGLSVGYHLSRRNIPYIILNADPRVGDSWRRRWDSLRLFTPARYDGLDGMAFPGSPYVFPTKDQMADFLETYANHFGLSIINDAKVDGLSRQADRYLVTAGDRRFEADHVVVAMGSYQHPRIPAFASDLDPGLLKLHSSEYRNPGQLREGGVLLVGAGNSGSEIARELALAGHKVWMSGRDTGHIPFRIEGFLGRHLLVHVVVGFVFYHLLTTATPFGRKARPQVVAQGGPLIRVKPKDLATLGVERVPRTRGARDGLPVLDDGRILDVSNVVWCTGYHPGFSWITLPVFDQEQRPIHERGVVAGEPGLYFVGLEFLYAMASGMVQGVGRDARHVVDRISTRLKI
jgi:putative flavoprotein involved in K+ transport